LRRLETQREILASTTLELAASGLPPDQLQIAIDQYVSPIPESPSEYALSPPPHCTGGAVDVTLCSCDGSPLDLGAEFDEFHERAWLRYFELFDSKDNAKFSRARDYRRILYHAMVGAGFAPYQFEFWHYEFRTRRAAAHHRRFFAEYGCVSPWKD
jgi:D-alanyl-D-alanine dipeptidase